MVANKRTAILLAVLFGFWAWLYTYGKDAWKFWVCFAINLFFVIFSALLVNSTEGEGRAYALIGAAELLLIVWLATWFFAVLDAIIKSPQRYAVRKGNWDKKRWFHVLVISLSISILVFGVARIVTVIPAPQSKYPEGSAEWYFEKAEEAIFEADETIMRASSTDEERRVYLKDAVRYLDEAIKLDPNNPYYFYLRGRTHYSLRENELALDDVNKAILLEPGFDFSNYKIFEEESFEEIFYSLRSRVYEELGMRDEAIADLRHAIDVAPYEWAEKAYEGQMKRLMEME